MSRIPVALPDRASWTPVNVREMAAYAQATLPRNAHDYFASGSGDMQSLGENERAFSRLRVVPRVLRDVSQVDTSTTVLGQRVASPLAIAATAMQRMAHPEGELATARAAARTGTLMCLSTLATTSMEDVAAANGDAGLRWFQLYVYTDRRVTEQLVRRAERAGYRALVLTVDTPMLGRREPDVRNRFRLPPHLCLANFAAMGGPEATRVRTSEAESGLAEYVASLLDRSLTWKDVEWLRSITTLPIVVKGVLSCEDAELAVRHGCAAIVVSNHGARQMDGVPATIEALGEVVQRVAGRCEVYMDGGVRRGADILKALALGARCVFVGRPVLWGLAYAGGDGVQQALGMLNDELKTAMLLCGCAGVSDIGADLVRHETSFHVVAPPARAKL